MKSVLHDRSSADCRSAATADEKKQDESVCIRREDWAESVAIKDGRERLNFNTTRQSWIRAKQVEVKEAEEGGGWDTGEGEKGGGWGLKVGNGRKEEEEE